MNQNLPITDRFWRTYPRSVVLLWLLFVGVLGASWYYLDLHTFIPGPASEINLNQNPGEVIAREAGIPPKDSLVILLSSGELKSEDSKFIDARESLVGVLRAEKLKGDPDTRLFKRVSTIGNSWFDDELFIAEDSRTLLIRAEPAVSISKSARALDSVPDLLKSWQQENPDFKYSYISSGTTDNEMFELIDRDLDRSLIYTLPLTLIILLWVFGSLVAAVIPLFMAITSLIASLGMAALLSHFVGPVCATSAQLVVLLVLAIGVDYALFMISRIREEVAAGNDCITATQIARTSTGRAVFWSGLTVALSLIGLFLMGDTVLTSMGLVSVIAVIITVAASVGVLPSLLIWLGPRLEYGKLGILARSRSSRALDRDQGGTFSIFSLTYWMQRWLTIGVSRPFTVVFTLGIALIAISSFSFRMELGSTVHPEMLPSSTQSAQAFAELKRNFPDQAGTDFSLIIAADNLGELESSEKLQPFIDRLLEFETVSGPISIDRSPNERAARYNFVVEGNGNDPRNKAMVSAVHQELIPDMQESLGVRAFLSGTLEYEIDDTARYIARTPEVFAVVLGLSMIMLLTAFRSIVVPVKAIVLNMLSTGVSFGVLALLFQASPVSLWEYGVIEGFVPALLFSILFGLSMDYHVFLLSRVREEFKSHGCTRTAVQSAVFKTSRTITGAALIMVSVFAIIATLELPLMKQLGVGLAVAVLLDATIIRTLLLPASMVLLGKLNWYMPRWLNWWPRIACD